MTAAVELQVCVLVSKQRVKSLKTILETVGKLDKSQKISILRKDHEHDQIIAFIGDDNKAQDVYVLRTTEYCAIAKGETAQASLSAHLDTIVCSLGVKPQIGFLSLALCVGVTSARTFSTKGGVLARTVECWLANLPPQLVADLPFPVLHQLSLSSWSYTVYGPLLLLPPNTFKEEPWPALLCTSLMSYIPKLYQMICLNLHVSHIALNAPIALLSSDSTQNVLRSPASLVPIYGFFGTVESPSEVAYERAFWASTRQHGIDQTWAPLYTMFSRGNISEKARILRFPELKAEWLGSLVEESTAVDLYAGIGYFAFCYAKAGVGKVLCWEINRWSVEGIRRGALKNKWSVDIIEENEEYKQRMDCGARLVVFQEDNRMALDKITNIRDRIPAVRHVNCGFLPTSKESWETAVGVLDPMNGGWIHAHENLAVNDIERRTREVVQHFSTILSTDARYTRFKAQCQHVEQVKSYAPGIIHCVLDIHVAPRSYESK